MVENGLWMMLSSVGVYTSRNLHNKLLENVMNAPVNLYHEKTPLGKLLKYFTKDVENVDRGFFENIWELMESIFDCLLRIAFAIFFSPYLILASIVNFTLLYRTFDYTKAGAEEITRIE
jgi:ABC-type multidrug transport system fused ATPase/permease subunit